ncbi:MAG: DUF4199 domain-containing protein [Flammeovirgaceae bacterium]
MEQQTTDGKPTVMSTALRYGGFMTLIGIAFNMILIVVGSSPFDRNWLNWIPTIISIALVVLAHNYFKQKGDGYMSYGQGLGIGFLSVLLSFLMGGLFLFIYINFIDPKIMDEVWEKTRTQMEDQGQNEEAIEIVLKYIKMFFWPIYLIGGAFMSLVVGLIISIFTQKKNPDPFV